MFSCWERVHDELGCSLLWPVLPSDQEWVFPCLGGFYVLTPWMVYYRAIHKVLEDTRRWNKYNLRTMQLPRQPWIGHVPASDFIHFQKWESSTRALLIASLSRRISAAISPEPQYNKTSTQNFVTTPNNPQALQNGRPSRTFCFDPTHISDLWAITSPSPPSYLRSSGRKSSDMGEARGLQLWNCVWRQ